MHFQEVDETVTFYIGPPPQPVTPTGAIGATLGTATNNLYSSPKKVSTLYITWLFYLNWIWRRSLKFAKFWPFGGPPPGPHIGATCTIWTNFESPAPKDDSCHVWLKSDHEFSRRRWNSYFLQRAPSPTCYPPQGPIGATLGTTMNNFCSSPNNVSTHYITWLFSFWESGEEDVWNLHGFGPLGPSPWPPWGPHILFEQLLIPYP